MADDAGAAAGAETCPPRAEAGCVIAGVPNNAAAATPRIEFVPNVAAAAVPLYQQFKLPAFGVAACAQPLGLITITPLMLRTF